MSSRGGSESRFREPSLANWRTEETPMRAVGRSRLVRPISVAVTFMPSMCSIRRVVTGAALLFFFGCNGDEQVGPDDVVFDTSTLIEDLRARGASAEIAGAVSQPFLSVDGQILRLNGEDVQTFEYASESNAQSDAARVSPDGLTIGTTMVSWVATPHFFLAGRVMAIYVGDSQAVLGPLRAGMGDQFAGG